MEKCEGLCSATLPHSYFSEICAVRNFAWQLRLPAQVAFWRASMSSFVLLVELSYVMQRTRPPSWNDLPYPKRKDTTHRAPGANPTGSLRKVLRCHMKIFKCGCFDLAPSLKMKVLLQSTRNVPAFGVAVAMCSVVSALCLPRLPFDSRSSPPTLRRFTARQPLRTPRQEGRVRTELSLSCPVWSQSSFFLWRKAAPCVTWTPVPVRAR